MKRLSLALLIGALFAMVMSASATAGLTAQQLSEVGVRPPPDARLPLDAPPTDLKGRSMTLGQALDDRPAMVIFVDYDCPQLCSPIVALAGRALGASGLSPDFSNYEVHRGRESANFVVQQPVSWNHEAPRCKQTVSRICSNL